ncbi:hypothetical protein [Microbacterium sp. CJ88]|uniref:hypothetical protein n=1 Tax=Microbacterium sp. CJ88 TaxID=3445672 RepID=UPI003F6587D6
MNIKKIGTMVAAASAVSLVLTGLSVTAANAADPTPLHFYFADGGDGHILPDNQVMNWTDQVLALPGTSAADLDTAFKGSADATGAMNFIAPIGKETQISAWIATGPQSFMPGTKDILQPNMSLTGFSNGNWAGVKAGGDYSIGFAWTINNGVGLATKGVLYRTIHVQPGGPGNWTFDTQAPVQTGVAPAFTTQPASATVTAGATATFTVAASGTPAPTLKWQSSTDGTTWADIAGATSASYTTPATAVADSGKKFRAIATNGTAPDATSNVATLTVNAVKTEPTQPTGSDAGKVTITDPAVDANTMTVNLGAANANKTLRAWAWSTPTDLGTVTTTATGDATVNIASLPAGQHTVAFTAPGDANFTVVAWGTFTVAPRTVNPGDPLSKNVALTAAVTAADLWSLNAEKTAVDFGNVARGAQVTKPLGKVTVVDDRNVLKGWDLKATWTDFTGAKNIGKDVLALAPKFAAGYTPTDAGITVSSVAGASGAKSLASSIAGVTTTATGALFDADLTFKAPANADAGAYTSTLTLTLTTK